MKKRAVVYLWTGDGWGKTTSAFGAALRALGHDKKVVVVQFMKGWKDRIGEYRIRNKLGKNLIIKQFGRKGWVNLKSPSKKDEALAGEGLEFAKEIVKTNPFLLVLDEINVTVSIGLLNEKDVLRFLDSISPKTRVYLTGRRATKGLIKRADYANEIRSLKRNKKLRGEKGIDY